MFLLTLIKIGFKCANFSLNSDSLFKTSILLKTFNLFCFAHIFSKISSTTSIFSSNLGSEESITWSNKFDSTESYKVDLKASTNFGGSSLINQIVSLTKISLGGI